MLQVLFKTPNHEPVRQIEPYHGLVVRREAQIGLVVRRAPVPNEPRASVWIFIPDIKHQTASGGVNYDTDNLIRCLNKNGWREVSAELVIGGYV